MFDNTELSHGFIVVDGNEVKINHDMILGHIENLVGYSVYSHFLEKVSDLNRKYTTDEDEAYVDGMLRVLNGAWNRYFVGQFYIGSTDEGKAILKYMVTIKRYWEDNFPLRKEETL